MPEVEQEAVKVRFCIPSLGAEIVLAKAWRFMLWGERRNLSLVKAMNKQAPTSSYGWHGRGPGSLGEVEIPQGTRLSVDRIYVRRGAESYDSVTFRIKKGGCPSNKKLEGTRFWAKLADVNKIVCYPIGSNPDVKQVFHSFIGPGERLLDLD